MPRRPKPLSGVQAAQDSAVLRLASAYEAIGERELAREQYLMVGEPDGSGDRWRRAQAALAGL